MPTKITLKLVIILFGIKTILKLQPLYYIMSKQNTINYEFIFKHYYSFFYWKLY